MRTASALSDLFEARSPLACLFWAAVGLGGCALLMAFWLLCTQQVRQADARHAATRMHQVALADCLVYVPRSTLGSCKAALGRAPTTVAAAEPVNTAGWSGALVVSFPIR